MIFFKKIRLLNEKCLAKQKKKNLTEQLQFSETVVGTYLKKKKTHNYGKFMRTAS